MDWSPVDEEEYMSEEQYIEEKLSYYLEIGAVELVGVDENGEIIYQINEKAKTDAPELWESHQQFVDDALIGLLERGLITVEYNENLEAMISLNEEGYEEAVKMGLIDPNDQEDLED